MKKIALFIALSIITLAVAYAQEPSKAELKVKELVKKYENVKDVECLTIGKGRGLGLVKMAFNQQFGRDFMKGVKSITIIDYTKASEEVCQALRKEIDSFGSFLKDFNALARKDNKDSKESAPKGYERGFASISEDEASISDFIFASELDGTKMIMYMAGKIKVE